MVEAFPSTRPTQSYISLRSKIWRAFYTGESTRKNITSAFISWAFPPAGKYKLDMDGSSKRNAGF